jgi:hypothetical protein
MSNEIQWLVVWEDHYPDDDPDNRRDINNDHYRVHESLKEAKEDYEHIRNLDTTRTVTLAQSLKSTDYMSL